LDHFASRIDTDGKSAAGTIEPGTNQTAQNPRATPQISKSQKQETAPFGAKKARGYRDKSRMSWMCADRAKDFPPLRPQ